MSVSESQWTVKTNVFKNLFDFAIISLSADHPSARWQLVGERTDIFSEQRSSRASRFNGNIQIQSRRSKGGHHQQRRRGGDGLGDGQQKLCVVLPEQLTVRAARTLALERFKTVFTLLHLRFIIKALFIEVENRTLVNIYDVTNPDV